MFRIDSDGAVVSIETPAAVGSTVGYFTEGNPGTGTVATKVSSDWLNAVQEEITGAIENSGLTLSKTVRTQLSQAINRAKVTSVSGADLTIATSDLFQVVLVTTGGSNRTINLPAVAGNINRRLKIKKVDSGAGAVIVDGNASETIDGTTTFTMPFQNDCIDIICDGAAWYIENYYSFERGTFAVNYNLDAGAGGSNTTSTVDFIRFGKAVTFVFPNKTDITAGATAPSFSAAAATIPTRLLPSTNVRQPCRISVNGTVQNQPGQVGINTDGSIGINRDMITGNFTSGQTSNGCASITIAFTIA